MRRALRVGLVASALVVAAGGQARTQVTSDLGDLSPPVRRINLLVDTRGETPPVYNGMASAALPAPGEKLAIQLFMPQAAGREAFGYIIQFDDTGGRFSDHFTIELARGWTTVLVRGPAGQENLQNLGLEAPLGPDGPSRFLLFPRPVRVSVTGLLATFQLTTLKAPLRNQPLQFGFTAAIHSTTPPARLWHYKIRQMVAWR